jgi:hypothetical protein
MLIPLIKTVVEEITNEIGARITGSPVREWAIGGAFGGFDKEKLDDDILIPL